jgi:ubiquinone biosynthesis protein
MRPITHADNKMPASVRVGFRRMRETARLSWRAINVLCIVCFHALTLAVMMLWKRRSVSRNRLFGTQLCRCCESLGPSFIKLGQILGVRPDLVSPECASELARLQTRVRPIPARQIRRALEHAYVRPFESMFAAFDDEPIGSGSIAQVHRAQLTDGRVVAVKVRRPGVDELIGADISLMALFARMAARLPAFRYMPVGQLVSELSALISQQLDFGREAASNREFRRMFDAVELVKVPVLIDTLCRPTVLVMEFVPCLRPMTRSDLALELQKAAVLRGLRALYRMVFAEGFIHADLHPGNIFVRKWGEVVILDTGMVTRLDDRARRDFVEFFFALVNGDGERCASILCESALFIAPDCQLDSFRRAIVELVARYAGLRSREFEIVLFVKELMETQRQYKICGSTDFVTTIVALVVFDGICKQVHPDCDFQAEARPFLIAAKYASRSPERMIGFMSS